MADPKTVLDFWFGGEGTQNALWFGGGATVDAEIRDRFEEEVREALGGRRDHWAKNPEGRLALVLLLDQFTRHIHRGTRAAFAGDRAAQRHAMKAIAKGEDRDLGPYQRAFLYMPFMHSEDRTLQRRGVQAFERLAAEAPAADRPACAAFLAYARDHAAIVERFGRFPDRNDILGRETRAEEARFLAEETRGWFEGEN